MSRRTVLIAIAAIAVTALAAAAQLPAMNIAVARAGNPSFTEFSEAPAARGPRRQNSIHELSHRISRLERRVFTFTSEITAA
ncbi:hypothetical protein [Microvirga solisilvae]|uniref:hypothetical protein n=1 Tax=Microvirga solisilvae TaxID=2919498 RepID=UPI001FAF99DE|nr:hypothetical protein [Microvirga solisilvae]